MSEENTSREGALDAVQTEKPLTPASKETTPDEQNKTTSLLPRPWNWLVAGMFVCGLVLLSLAPPHASFVQKLSHRVAPERWLTFVGILMVGVTASHVIATSARHVIRKLLKLTGDNQVVDSWSPALLGTCESVMYPLALFIGKAEFIGVWLAVKVAGQWSRWDGRADVPDQNMGRRRFNGFLVGNAISVMLGVAIWVALRVWTTP